MNAALALSEEELCSLTESVWATTLNLPVQRTEYCLKPLKSQELCTSRNFLSGDWIGSVRIQCPVPLARKVASAMFDRAAEDTTAVDIRDALGEITNIIAGHVKALAPEPCTLSTPTDTRGRNSLQSSDLLTIVGRQAFDCEGDVFEVAVFERSQSE
jgi:Chemotaxis phosphatase CheX